MVVIHILQTVKSMIRCLGEWATSWGTLQGAGAGTVRDVSTVCTLMARGFQELGGS